MTTDIAGELDSFMKRLFPLCRSISGNANRATLSILSEIVPIEQHEVASGSLVNGWRVPEEWSIRDAYIETGTGDRVVKFSDSNLHVVSYSTALACTMSWEELEPHLHMHPTMPNVIPYRTSYYKRTWGFCVTKNQYEHLKHDGGPFRVVIDSDLYPGSITYGECLLPGRSKKEILISCYICHPSMANDSLSGVVLTAFLARYISNLSCRYWSYRIVFVPETIGAIAYCSINESALKLIDFGLVITTVGGPGQIGYKQSWDDRHPINSVVEEVLHECDEPFIKYPFDIHGSDERQYSSVGLRINCVTISKDRYYEYDEYHSSADDLHFVTGNQLSKSFRIYTRLIDKLEQREIYVTEYPNGEPMLSGHGLYPKDGGVQNPEPGELSDLDIILWILFFADGTHSLQDISRILQVPLGSLKAKTKTLELKGILRRV